MVIKLTQFDNTNNWIKGTIDDFSFSAKHFDEGSMFGINDGRTSKLEIWEGKEFSWDNIIAHYNRGWDIEPETEEQKEICNTLVDCLEKLPKRFPEPEDINEDEISL